MLFNTRRFGLFVHWGLYSIPAWHEQIQWRMDMPKEEYVLLKEKFNPVAFDPCRWIDAAEAAGMQYLCFTTKHHDGFCMWDTKFTDYNIMNTPWGKDALKMIADACHERNFGLHLYYSNPDWHHPNAVNQGGNHQLLRQNKGDEPDEDKYIEYIKNQVNELCSNYGKIDALFWDIPQSRYEPSINQLVRTLQPGILINDRGYDKGDYDTPERTVPEGKRFSRYTEACQSIGRQSWGYREDEDYYSNKFLMQSIDKIMAMGGNYLLNVGPKADGALPKQALDILETLGSWYNRVKEAFEGTTPISSLFDRDDCMFTRNGNVLYIHFYKSPQSAGLLLNPLVTEPICVTVLNNGKKLDAKVERIPVFSMPHSEQKECLRVKKIPANELIDEVIILKLEFENLDRALSLCGL
ncbi:MAG: alpha-L-fucosidase [Firmicutes bacterium]|nr:alpha-L-fucosidase [Bacillota bacterium]